MLLSSFSKFSDAALLVLRIGVGGLFAFLYGIPKLIAGPDKWEKVGAAMGNFGITIYPEIWGFLAAMTESVGALLFAIGFLFRPSSLMLGFVMVVAATMHLKGDGLSAASHAIELGLLFLCMAFIGPGKYAVDK